jgi:hypothetical protein
VDISNGVNMLSGVELEVNRFVDIERRWRVPYKQSYHVNKRHGFISYIASIIGSLYMRLKEGFTQRDHHC